MTNLNTKKIIINSTIYTLLLLSLAAALSFVMDHTLLMAALLSELFMGWITIVIMNNKKASKLEKQRIYGIAGIVTLGVIMFILIPALI